MIAADDVFALGAALFGLAALGFWVDAHPLGRKTSGVLWILVGGMLLSNFGALPLQSPSYDFVHSTVVPLAIPLLLLKADLRKIFRDSGAVMATFLIASLATLCGALVGFAVLDLGEMGARVAGVYTGGWIGGAVNMVAVSEAVGMSDTEFSVALSASSLVSVLALASLVALPTMGFLIRWLKPGGQPAASQDAPPLQGKPAQGAAPGRHGAGEHVNLGLFSAQGGPGAAPENGTGAAPEDGPGQPSGRRPGGAAAAPGEFRLTHISGALALSWFICWLAEAICAWLGLERYAILVITTLAITAANVFPKTLRSLKGDFELGMLLMYLFFAVVGAGTDATLFLTSAPVLLLYGLLILALHLTLVLIAAKLLRIDLPQAVVASGAALVGPAPTAAIASSQGWQRLITPGIMCGIFGYAIATFIGVTVTAVLS